MRAQEDEVKAALGRPPITCGWDPGRPNEPPLLLLHPPHDATATENVSVPSLPLNPRAPWRAPEVRDNAALGCLSITGGWDPGRSNASPLLLKHPPHLPLLRNDTTTTENITAHDRSPIVICGWDPGKDDDEDSLSDCETALACDDGSTFADDFAVAGGISGNGVPTPPGTTPTTARAFADPGTGHDDDAVCDDDEDPD